MEVDLNVAFHWKCQPEAEALVVRFLDAACRQNSFIASLSNDLLKHTSTRLFDWVDHIVAGYSEKLENELEQSGYVAESAAPAYRVYYHPGAQLPRFVIRDSKQPNIDIAIAVDRIADFLNVRGISGCIEGTPFGGYRRCSIFTEDNVTLYVVERRGTLTMEPIYNDEGYIEKYFEAVETWKGRPRTIENEDEAFSKTLVIAENIVKKVGQDLAACIILECERDYWQAKNTAGQLQKNRQDKLGMGWANHDHHTFRSSRRHFVHLVRLFEILGFHCRERYYAGKEAGWGAQIMENPRSRLVLFLDVDLLANEIEIEFAHHRLPERKELGTIGLWCGLHGDSILSAGMHHLEAQFMFDELKSDLSNLGVGMMDPFSSFSYLKQAFMKGDHWPVNHQRIQNLVSEGKITEEQARKFEKTGAIGSHLENLQRREGYKGFNQKNVSIIIQKTDPRII